MKSLFILLMCLCSGLALADPGSVARITQLETTMNKLQQEQQSLYQQFQMTQELRKIEIEQNNLPTAQSSPIQASADPRTLNYDDTIRLQRERQERIQKYTADLSKLNARYSELADQKKALLDQMIELSQRPKR